MESIQEFNVKRLQKDEEAFVGRGLSRGWNRGVRREQRKGKRKQNKKILRDLKMTKIVLMIMLKTLKKETGEYDYCN